MLSCCVIPSCEMCGSSRVIIGLWFISYMKTNMVRLLQRANRAIWTRIWACIIP
ncbi:hypothetical protein Hanom_Chr07g00679861 [Helianthus anomalus]